MKSIKRLLLAGVLAAALPASWAQAPASKTEVLWLGQSAFRITIPPCSCGRTKPDLVLMPIGGHFTMGPVDAAYATREWLRPRFVIPMHYGANPLGRGTPEEYTRALGATGTHVMPLKPSDKAAF